MERVIVYTGKDLRRMREEGGCGQWTASPIKKTKPSAHAARITIEFETYAMLHVPAAWQILANGQRFPVAYLETSELVRRLQLNPDELAWKPLLGSPAQQQVAEACASYPIAADAEEAKGASLTDAIAEAKRRLAESLGIGVEKIEITIRL